MSGPAKASRSGLSARLAGVLVGVLLLAIYVGCGVHGQRMQDVLKGSPGGGSSEGVDESDCPQKCNCLGKYIECRNLGSLVPVTPDFFTALDLSQNELTDDVHLGIGNRTKLKELNLSKNQLHQIPVFRGLFDLTKLQLAHNQIEAIGAEALLALPKLNSLDLSKNRIVAVLPNSFPSSSNMVNLNLNGNNIKELDNQSLVSLRLLVDLKLNQNQLESIPIGLFRSLKKLKRLDLSGNRIAALPFNTFANLSRLRILRLSSNRLEQLNVGVFHGLANLQTLELDHNRLSSIQKDGFYNVTTLATLSLANNSISTIAPMAWEFCQRLVNIDLSHNRLTAIDAGTFHCLDKLRGLNLTGNAISVVADGSFNCTANLDVLDLSKNHISYTIEDMQGPFKAMHKLTRLNLNQNKIKSINRNAFAGLTNLKQLDLIQNNITSIQSETFARTTSLVDLQMNTAHLLCDCNILWLHDLLATGVHPDVQAVCDYPSSMRGIRITALSASSFKCNDTPKPRIIDEPPATLLAIKERNLTLACSATSTSATAMTFKWKRDMTELTGANIRYETSVQPNTNNTLASSWLTLTDVGNEHVGRYQCVVGNTFGTTYSQKVKITVASFPRFRKFPANLTLNSTGTARLDCAAFGDPQPQIAWQKDGGNNFPAATERRMHVMPSDDAFFIINAKLSDMGVYTCTAENPAGIIKANATLTVLEAPSFVRPMENKEIITGKSGVVECLSTGSPKPSLSWLKDGVPIPITERHFFAGDDQLLVITDATATDAGTYACTISNDLGESSGAMQLIVTPAIVANVVNVDEMTGIVIITVVCCAVATSVIWVFIIYHTRKGNGCTKFVTGNTGTTAPPQDPYHGLAMTSVNGTLLNQSGPNVAGIYESQSLLPTTHSAMIVPMNQRTFNSDYDDLSCKDSGTGDSTKRSHRAPSSTHQCTSENDDCCIDIDKTSTTVSFKSSPTTVSPSSDDIEHFPSPSIHHASTHSIHHQAAHCSSPAIRVNIQTNQLNDLLSRDSQHIAQSPTQLASPTASVRSPTLTSSSLNRSNRSSNSIPIVPLMCGEPTTVR